MNSKAAFLAFPIFVLFLLALPSQASNASQAGFDLPQPNGCYPVGTKTIVLRDPHRSRDLRRRVETATGLPTPRAHTR